MTDRIKLPKLDKGEIYAGGIILPDGHYRHTILLPGEHEAIGFNKAQVWCKKQGGSAPERIEQALLLKFHKQEFRPVAYWSCEQLVNLSSWAWIQYFDDGLQSYLKKSRQLAVRAVRRVVV